MFPTIIIVDSEIYLVVFLKNKKIDYDLVSF